MDDAKELDVSRMGILRMLIYPIQFDPKPTEGVDRVLKMVVFANHLNLPVSDVVAAIDAGLASNARLCELIPQEHTEAAIRDYLAAVRTRLDHSPIAEQD
jgi:hypothetical protein